MAKRYAQTLTNPSVAAYTPIKLTENTNSPFILCFKYPLQKGYTFSEMSKADIRSFQRFLDKVSKMTVQQVDKTFRRQPDHNDMYKGQQIQHYEVTNKFRIHVVLEGGRYKVIRMDPNHTVHK